MQIRDLIYHTSLSSTTGKLYNTSLELLLVEAGLGAEVHWIPEAYLTPLCTNTLIKSTCPFLIEFQLELRHSIKLTLGREGDGYLMESFMSGGALIEELSILNRCRLHLRTLSISDIATGVSPVIRKVQISKTPVFCWV
jgi:hypothetical protein